MKVSLSYDNESAKFIGLNTIIHDYLHDMTFETNTGRERINQYMGSSMMDESEINEGGSSVVKQSSNKGLSSMIVSQLPSINHRSSKMKSKPLSRKSASFLKNITSDLKHPSLFSMPIKLTKSYKELKLDNKIIQVILKDMMVGNNNKEIILKDPLYNNAIQYVLKPTDYSNNETKRQSILYELIKHAQINILGNLSLPAEIVTRDSNYKHSLIYVDILAAFDEEIRRHAESDDSYCYLLLFLRFQFQYTTKYLNDPLSFFSSDSDPTTIMYIYLLLNYTNFEHRKISMKRPLSMIVEEGGKQSGGDGETIYPPNFTEITDPAMIFLQKLYSIFVDNPILSIENIPADYGSEVELFNFFINQIIVNPENQFISEEMVFVIPPDYVSKFKYVSFREPRNLTDSIYRQVLLIQHINKQISTFILNYIKLFPLVNNKLKEVLQIEKKNTQATNAWNKANARIAAEKAAAEAVAAAAAEAAAEEAAARERGAFTKPSATKLAMTYAFIGLREYLIDYDQDLIDVQYDEKIRGESVDVILLEIIKNIQHPFFFLELSILYQVVYNIKIYNIVPRDHPFYYLHGLIGNIDDMLEAGSKRIIQNGTGYGYDVSRVIIVENGKTNKSTDVMSKLKAFLKAEENTFSFVDNAFNKSNIIINSQEVKLPGGLCFPASILDGWSANGCTMGNESNTSRVTINKTSFDYVILDKDENIHYQCNTSLKFLDDGKTLDKNGNSSVTISTNQLFNRSRNQASVGVFNTINTNMYNPKEFSAGNVLKKQLDILVNTIKEYDVREKDFWNYISGGANFKETLRNGLAKCSADMGQIMSAICYKEAKVQLSNDRACGTARPIVLMLYNEAENREKINPDLFIGNGSSSMSYMGVLPKRFVVGIEGGKYKKKKTRKDKKHRNKKKMTRKLKKKLM
jgi:hypothetical protein